MSAPISLDEDTLLRTNLIDGNIEQGAYEETRTSVRLKMLSDSFAATRP